MIWAGEWTGDLWPGESTFNCGDWQELVQNAALVASNKFTAEGNACFRVVSVDAKNYLQHHWVEISCRSSPLGDAGSYVTIDPWPSAGNGNIDDDSYAVDWKPKDIQRFSLVEQVIRPCGKPPLDGR